MVWTKNSISTFWHWFSENQDALSAKGIQANLVEELEAKLFAIQRFDWEIGPGRKAASFFALSPRGDREALGLTRSIIAEAPQLPDWEFYPAKPPRDWNLTFDIRVDGAPVTFDGKRWEFVLYEFEDGTYDLLLKPDSTQGLSEECLNWAATIIADGELGEETRINKIGSIEIVTDWDRSAVQAARMLEVGLLAKVVK